MLAWGFVMVLLFIISGRYGRQAVEWVLMKVYEVFVGSKNHIVPY